MWKFVKLILKKLFISAQGKIQTGEEIAQAFKMKRNTLKSVCFSTTTLQILNSIIISKKHNVFYY